MSELERASEETVIEAIWGPVRARRRRRERETPLSVDDICRVALELIDAGGLEALTMRSLAQRLDASASTLYWYVRSKEELLDRVRDEISAEMCLLELDVEQEWRAAVTDGAHRIRTAMLAHPRAATLVAGRPAIGPNALRGIERLLSVFVRAGFGAGTIGPAYRVFVDYTMAVTVRECLYIEAERAEGSETAYPVAELIERHLSPDAFPLLTSFGDELFSGSWSELFELGLAQLLTALESARELPIG